MLKNEPVCKDSPPHSYSGDSLLVTLLQPWGLQKKRELYENISGSYENISGSYKNISELYENISGSYENISELYEIFSGSYENISELYEIFSGSYENISELYEIFSGSDSDSSEIMMSNVKKISSAIILLPLQGALIRIPLPGGDAPGYVLITPSGRIMYYNCGS